MDAQKGFLAGTFNRFFLAGLLALSALGVSASPAEAQRRERRGDYDVRKEIQADVQKPWSNDDRYKLLIRTAVDYYDTYVDNYRATRDQAQTYCMSYMTYAGQKGTTWQQRAQYGAQYNTCMSQANGSYRQNVGNQRIYLTQQVQQADQQMKYLPEYKDVQWGGVPATQTVASPGVPPGVDPGQYRICKERDDYALRQGQHLPKDDRCYTDGILPRPPGR